MEQRDVIRKRPIRWFLVYSLVVAVSFIVLLSTDLFATTRYTAEQPMNSQQNASFMLPVRRDYHSRLNRNILQDYNISELALVERQKERRRHLADRCNKISGHEATSLKPSELRWIYVDDAHKTLYCAVPKVATTNWKRVLLMLTGKMNVSRLDQLPGADVHGRLQWQHLVRLNRLHADEIKLRLQTYFQFLFVRDPFERLVSAYKSKFLSRSNTYFQKRDGRRIVRRYRVNPRNESLQRGHDVTFSEFVQYIVDPRTVLNEHWKPYEQLCKPCQISYDVIGKYETLEQDAVHVIAAMSANSDAGDDVTVRFPPVQRTNRTLDCESRIASVAVQDLQRLCTVYAADFDLFGYSCPHS